MAHVVLSASISIIFYLTSIISLSHIITRISTVSLKSVRVFYHKKVTRISTLEYTLDDDEISTRASRSNTGTSLKNGDIYLDKYEGWYSTRDEKFWTDTEAEQNNYMDGDSKTIKLVKMSEACYMFRMSKYHDRLLKHIEDNPEFVRPAKARKSLLTRLRKDRLR